MFDYDKIILQLLNSGVSGKESGTEAAVSEEAETTAQTAADGMPPGAEGALNETNLLWAVAIFFAGAAAALLCVWIKKALTKGKNASGQGNGDVVEEFPVTKNVSREITFSIGKLHALGGRKNQQDSFSVSEEELIPTHGLLAVVADGMGGLSDGDQMSQCAITAMMETFYRLQGDPDRILLMLVESATQAVNAKLGAGNYSTSGSTLVAGLIQNGAFHYVSVGDSRICLYRNDVLYQLNREHVFRQELEIRAINHESTWEAADTHPKANGLTSFLGMGALKYVDIPSESVVIRPGDKFILMSDGVYNSVEKAEMTEQLKKPAQEAADGIGKLIEEKNLNGQDNYTAIIVACE